MIVLAARQNNERKQEMKKKENRGMPISQQVRIVDIHLPDEILK